MASRPERAPLARDWLGVDQLRLLLRWAPVVLVLVGLTLVGTAVDGSRPTATARILVAQPDEPDYDTTVVALVGELAGAAAPSAAAAAASPTLDVEPAREGGHVDVVVRADTLAVATEVARSVATRAVEAVEGQQQPGLARMRERARVLDERVAGLEAELAAIDDGAASGARALQRDAARSGLEVELEASRATLAVLRSDLAGLSGDVPDVVALDRVLPGDPDAVLGPLTVDDLAGAAGIALAAGLVVAVAVGPREPRRRLGPSPTPREVAR